MQFATTPDEVRAATDAALTEADALVAAVVKTGGTGTFATVLLPLDEADARVSAGYASGAFMARVHADPAVRDAGQSGEERLDRWRADLPFREDLAAAISTFAASPEAAALVGEQRRLLDRLVRDVRRAGHGLDSATREEVRHLEGRLVELQSAFQRNIDEFEDGLDLTRDELGGLSDDFVAGLRPGASPGTFRVTLDAPEVYPFLQQARRRDLRQVLEHRQFNAAREANEPLLAEALAIRRRIATLLGYPSWAHYAIEVRMAGDPAAVRAFYDGFVPPLRARLAGEVARLEEILREDGEDGLLRTWDWRYCATRLRRRDFAVDPDEVRGYLPLDAVLDGLLGLCTDVFGLTFEPIADPAAWHPDVVGLQVRDAATGAEIGDILLDLHPREGKYGHAAAWPLVPGRRLGDGTRQRPLTAIVANVPRPGADRPALLRHEDVVTLFHEFGHVLHMTLTRAELARFSGANTEWDFVEAPSQILEHWAWQADVLARFARHHVTGEPIPRALVDRLVASRDLDVALTTLRQCYLGLVDLELHGPEATRDIGAVDRGAFAVWGLPYHDGTLYPCQFGHLMGGYDAGYYGYLWSKVYGDDMFSRFEAEGSTSPTVGADYRREILEPNGTRDGMELLRAFLGRDPSPATFLRRLGIEVGATT
ncbi:MAG TPA: M3 family metallopeptidase [Patescibacteria group bacterium]|nr:M3 family metallopeptidase [Patescibacteria group bacterium]